MATCKTCDKTILFGGKRHGDLRFCSDACLDKGEVLITAANLDPAVVQSHAHEIHRGLCPQCGGSGPVDVHTSHEVWSLVFMTSWKGVSKLSCRPCGVRQQLGGLVWSSFVGWWGIPWGILVTPAQIVRNVVALARPPATHQPSDQLLAQSRIMLAEGAGPEEG